MDLEVSQIHSDNLLYW